MKLLTPFSEISAKTRSAIRIGWLATIIAFWLVMGMGNTHLFPTISQVANGFVNLFKEGLAVHVASSLWLCAMSVFIGAIISLLFCYLSPLPLLEPLAAIISKLRYLPLTGISYYMAILISDARNIQVWVLVVFMTTFLITSILGVISDIPPEEFDHAKTQGCTRWEMLWEVVIKGRADYMQEAIRQNLAIVWMMLVNVESILIAAGGLGTLIKNSDKLGDNGRVVAIMIIIVVFGLALDFIMSKSRKLTFRYSNF